MKGEGLADVAAQPPVYMQQCLLKYAYVTQPKRKVRLRVPGMEGSSRQKYHRKEEAKA